jgi:predicted metal-binding membrane protein
MCRRSTVERLLGNGRRIVAVAVGLMVLLSAAFLLAGGGTGMDALAMTAATGPLGALIARTPDLIRPEIWTPAYAGVIFLMWWLMMVAMMLPAAAPVILLYGALHPAGTARAPFAFLAGYLAVWAGFSALATALQGALAAAGLLSPMYMTLSTPLLGGAVLIGAGLYQLTPLKAACLNSCRGPVETLTRLRREDRTRAFSMGLRHGAQCLGCCWALMALLFVGGVMNLVWILGLALIVAVEKLSPWGDRLSRPLGAGLVAAGLALMTRAYGAG